MLVYINKYRDHWLSPYTIMEKVLFWKKWTDPEFDLYDDQNAHYTDWLTPVCHGLQKFLNIVHPKIDYVKIDPWDSWSMDRTLAKIILPMLKQLQATKQGAPVVDDEDVPEELRSTNAPQKENEWDTDDLFFKRWDWVLSEVIWAFEQLNDDDDERKFYSGVCDWIWTKSEKQYPNPDTGAMEFLYQSEHGPNHTFTVDSEGLKAHHQRVDNALRLFGKYYRSLWD